MSDMTTIPASNHILFFPVRLETCCEHRNNGTTDLKVRIIPDEIQVQYEVTRLTRADIADGRRFWVRWFIASGNPDREFETWRLFCEKHGVNSASRIAYLTRPRGLSKYKKGGTHFTKRPFAYRDARKRLIDIAAVCQQIYDSLSKIHITECSAPDKTLTDSATDSFRAISASLASLSVVLDGSPQIVDYLAEKVDECAGYLERRLDSISLFYDRYPQFQEDPGSFDLRDSDYFAFGRLREQVRDFRARLSRKTVSLEEMVDQYLEHPGFAKDFFGKDTWAVRYPLDRKSYPAPTLPMLPDRFHLWLSLSNGNVYEASGKPVAKDLQIGIDLEGSSSAFRIDAEGDVVIPQGMKWLVDYDDALQKGMAITVNIPAQDAVVEKLYVYGVKEERIKEKTLQTLFRSHLYWEDQFSMLKIGTPTNQIEGTRPVETPEDEELVKLKYRQEILEEGRRAPANADARALSSLLGLKYTNSPFARALQTDNTEMDNARKANKALWEYFKTKMVDTGHVPSESENRILDHIGNFFLNYANARGIAPMFRIGDQPWGIAPGYYLSSGFTIGEDAKYVDTLLSFLHSFYQGWFGSIEKEYRSESMKGSGADQGFLRMLSQNPRSVNYRKRPFYYGPLDERETETITEESFNDIRVRNKFIKAFEGMGLHWASPVAGDFGDFDPAPLVATVKKALPSLEDWQAERLVSEFLDTFSYRLDVWFMAYASYVIKNHPTPGLRVGAYGWIYNLDISKNPAEDKGEYILAPSIQHALTAAVLRSAYLQTKADGQDTHMCINLSSMRARQALQMIDGLKQGMSTGMILGADLERYLHDAFNRNGKNMDKFIYPLRKLFPLTLDIQAEDKRAEDYALQVINGESLLNTILEQRDKDEKKQGKSAGRISQWLKGNALSLSWFATLKDPKTGLLFTDAEAEELFLAIERMADSYDALNDLLLAEGVHRLVAGDKASFAAITSFMSSKTGNLPSPSVLDTPMNYAVLAHKTGLALPCTKTARPRGILAVAEPTVNDWLAAQMGPLKNVIFYVDYRDGDKVSFYESSLQEIGMTPLEFLHLSAYPGVLRHTLELAWRKLDWRNRKHGTVRILTGDPEETPAGEWLPDHSADEKTCLYEFSLLADNLASLLSRSRAMRAGDVVPSISGDADEEKRINLKELKYRYLSAYDALSEINGKLTAFLGAPDRNLAHPMSDAQVFSLYDLAGKCTRAGLFNEVIPFDPSMLVEDIDPVLDRPAYDKAVEKQMGFLTQLKLLSEALAQRLAEADKHAPDNGSTLRPSAYIEALQTLTVKNLRVIPRFSVKDCLDAYPFNNTSFRKMARDFQQVENLTGNAFIDWMDEVAEVRPGMKLYREIRMLQQLRGDSYLETNAGIFQTLSQQKIAREWLGCKVSDEKVLDDADSLVLFERQNFVETQDNAGLIFDSWLEYIPFRKQTAGLVYRCDVPDAEAPQALIYGFINSSNTKEKWNIDDVRSVIIGAATLSEIRTIDPEQWYSDEYPSLLGSFLTARAEDLIDKKASLEEQIKALEEARKTDLVLDQTKFDSSLLK